MSNTGKCDKWEPNFEQRDDYVEFDQGYYKMATTAYHKMSDISRSEPSLCIVSGMTDDYYVGQFATGLGMIHVQFPIETTRSLTEEEVQEYAGKAVQINNNPPHYQYSEEELREVPEIEKQKIKDIEIET